MKNNFNYFKDIKHDPLRIYNMSVMFYNLRQDFGDAVAEDYVSGIDMDDRFTMVEIINSMIAFGVDHVREEVLRGMTFEDTEYMEEVKYG